MEAETEGTSHSGDTGTPKWKAILARVGGTLKTAVVKAKDLVVTGVRKLKGRSRQAEA